MPNPLAFDIGVYRSENYIVLDFETTNRDKGSFVNPDNRIVLACWALGPEHPFRKADNELPAVRGIRTTVLSDAPGRDGAVRSQFGSEYEQAELIDAVRRADFLVAHHAKFELGWLARCGLDLRSVIVWDTMIGEYVLAGNRKFDGGLGLDATLRRRGRHGKLSYVQTLLDGGVCPSRIEETDLLERCVGDVWGTRDIFLQQRVELFGSHLQNAMYGRCIQTPMLADMETRGVQIDDSLVRAESGVYGERFGAAQLALSERYGSINFGSSKQLIELVYTRLGFDEVKDHKGKPIRTPGGKPATGEGVLNKLRAKTEDQKQFLKLYSPLVEIKREVQILEQLLGCVNEDNGRLYAQFNQTVTQNHRLSSTGGKWGLQFQNFPRSFKKLFRARNPGWVVVEGDCPQLEFRVAGDLAHDPVARTDILSRRDVHSLTSEVTGFSRQDSKAHTFKPLYGGRSGPPRLVAYYDAFRARYAGIYDHQMGWVYEVLRNKSLTIASGLRFYWPDTELTRSGYITNTPSIFNYPISSFATADISQLSLLLVWHAIGDLDSFICNTIHDSGVLEVPQEELDKVREIMVECYTVKIYEVLKRLYDYEFSLPLGVGIKAGVNWGVGEEQKNESKLFTFSV